MLFLITQDFKKIYNDNSIFFKHVKTNKKKLNFFFFFFFFFFLSP